MDVAKGRDSGPRLTVGAVRAALAELPDGAAFDVEQRIHSAGPMPAGPMPMKLGEPDRVELSVSADGGRAVVRVDRYPKHWYDMPAEWTAAAGWIVPGMGG